MSSKNVIFWFGHCLNSSNAETKESNYWNYPMMWCTNIGTGNGHLNFSILFVSALKCDVSDVIIEPLVTCGLKNVVSKQLYMATGHWV